MDAPKRLTQKGYRPRLIEERLDTLMRAFGCVEINGPKWCGKTWTALSRSASVSRLDEPAQRAAAEVDPSLALIGDAPHLVDEWQEVPEVWDAARRFVDASGNERGTLLLTGSTALKSEERSHVRHSGTGRIARLSMRPMALCESGDGEPLVSLASLFKGEDFAPQRRESTVDDVARWCCRGGWPANLGLSEDLARETASQYVHSVLDVNVLDEGMSPELAHGLLRALAMNESQAVTYKTLVKDASYGEAGPDERTIAAYLDLFNRLKLTEDLCGWGRVLAVCADRIYRRRCVPRPRAHRDIGCGHRDGRSALCGDQKAQRLDWSLLRPGGLLERGGPSTAFDRVPGKAYRPFRISYGLGRPAGVLHLNHGRGQPRARLAGRRGGVVWHRVRRVDGPRPQRWPMRA